MKKVFQIIKPKYSKLKRNIYGILLFLFGILTGPLLNIQSGNRILDVIIMFTPLAIFVIVNYKIVEQVNLIGTLEFDEYRLTILTKALTKVILIKEVMSIKINRGTTGGSKTITGSKTLVVSIQLKDKTEINIHITREWFKENIKQKKQTFWSKNVDFFDLLDNQRIRWKEDPNLKESDCIQE